MSACLLLLHGSEVYDIDRNKASYIAQGEKLGEETQCFDNDFSEAYAYVNAPTFLSFVKRAIVTIDNLDVFKSDLLQEYVKEAREKTAAGFIMLVYPQSIDAKKMKALLELEKEGGFQLLPCEKTKDMRMLEERIRELLAEENVTFHTDAIKELICRLDYLNNSDTSLVTFRNYIYQLKYIANESEVTLQHVVENVPDLREGNQFVLARLIANKKTDAIALEIDKLLRKDGVDVFTILGSLFREYRMAYKFNKGFDIKEIKDKPPYMKPALSGMTVEQLLDGMSVISNCLSSIRTGSMEQDSALKYCIASLSLPEHVE